MTPRPLHRSLTFWSGIFLMSFIAWAWWKSLVTEFSYNSPRMELQNYAGYVSVSWLQPRVISHHIVSAPGLMMIIRQDFRIHPMPSPAFLHGQDKPGFPIVSLGQQLAEEDKPYFHATLQEAWAHQRRGNFLLLLPHWLLLLAAGVTWSGLLVWRARRHRGAGKPVLTEAP